MFSAWLKLKGLPTHSPTWFFSTNFCQYIFVGLLFHSTSSEIKTTQWHWLVNKMKSICGKKAGSTVLYGSSANLGYKCYFTMTWVKILAFLSTRHSMLLEFYIVWTLTYNISVLFVGGLYSAISLSSSQSFSERFTLSLMGVFIFMCTSKSSWHNLLM